MIRSFTAFRMTNEHENLCGSVLLTSVYAGLTSLSAMLTMVMLVLAALVGALLADFDAFLDDVLDVVGTAGDESGGEAADIGAVAVQLNAGHHHLDVVFVQAGIGTHFAGHDAAAECVEYGLVFL